MENTPAPAPAPAPAQVIDLNAVRRTAQALLGDDPVYTYVLEPLLNAISQQQVRLIQLQAEVAAVAQGAVDSDDADDNTWITVALQGYYITAQLTAVLNAALADITASASFSDAAKADLQPLLENAVTWLSDVLEALPEPFRQALTSALSGHASAESAQPTAATGQPADAQPTAATGRPADPTPAETTATEPTPNTP